MVSWMPLQDPYTQTNQQWSHWLWKVGHISCYEHVNWHDPSPCLHVYETCNIIIVIFGYVRSITNHRPWHKYQWFITIATYWSNCDVTEMHARFVSPLSIRFVINSTEITWDLHPQVNIFIILLKFLQIPPEEIMTVIETCRARLWLIFYCHSVFIGTSSSSFIYHVNITDFLSHLSLIT